jgi:carboxylesterase type B
LTGNEEVEVKYICCPEIYESESTITFLNCWLDKHKYIFEAATIGYGYLKWHLQICYLLIMYQLLQTMKMAYRTIHMSFNTSIFLFLLCLLLEATPSFSQSTPVLPPVQPLSSPSIVPQPGLHGPPDIPFVTIGNSTYSGVTRKLQDYGSLVSSGPLAENAVAAYMGVPYASHTIRFGAPGDFYRRDSRWGAWGLPLNGEGKNGSVPLNCYQATKDAAKQSEEIDNGVEGSIGDYLVSILDWFRNGGRRDKNKRIEREAEDCLTFNLFVPFDMNVYPNIEGWKPTGTYEGSRHDTRQYLPIMVYFYGGGFQRGYSSALNLDATVLAAKQNVIVAVPNYRTSIFGFPGYSATPNDPRTYNVGLQDQRQALEFIKFFAKDFKGDPDRITVFGQSAGARSADFHVLTMGSEPWRNGSKRAEDEKPLFKGAIMQSGSPELIPLADWRKAKAGGFWPLKDDERPRYNPNFLRAAKLVGCPASPHDMRTWNCMQDQSAEDIRKVVVENDLYFPSMLDDGIMTVENPRERRKRGQFNKMPILMGTNANEQSYLLRNEPDVDMETYLATQFPFPGHKVNVAEMKKRIKEKYGEKFPNEKFKTAREAIAAIETDLAYTCLTSRESKESAEGGAPTWQYFYNATFESTQQATSNSGAYHGIELRYVFGNNLKSSKVTKEEVKFSEAIQKIWADFARDPENSLAKLWPKRGSAVNDLGVIGPDGKIHATNPAEVDRNCDIFEGMYWQ